MIDVTRQSNADALSAPLFAGVTWLVLLGHCGSQRIAVR